MIGNQLSCLIVRLIPCPKNLNFVACARFGWFTREIVRAPGLLSLVGPEVFTI